MRATFLSAFLSIAVIFAGCGKPNETCTAQYACSRNPKQCVRKPKLPKQIHLRASNDDYGPRVTLESFLTKPANPIDFGLINLNEVLVDDNPQIKRIRAHNTVKTKQITQVSIQAGKGIDFDAIVGPPFRPQTPVYPTGDAIYLVESRPICVKLMSGWAYLCGTQPMVRTERGTFNAEGSKILVQIRSESNPVTHRMFFLGGTSASVKSNSHQIELKSPEHLNRWVDVFSDGTLSNISAETWDADEETNAFISQVLLTGCGE